tara:strand:+ start:781 stop:1164 length:384 start_codon:yes stop_codon:yes gene_type:complete
MKTQVQKYLEQLDSLSSSVEQAKIKASVINAEENKLGWVTTDFKQITVIEDKIEPFRELWTTSLTFRTEYNNWTRSPIFNLERQTVEKNHQVSGKKNPNRRSARPATNQPTLGSLRSRRTCSRLCSG